MSSGDNLLSCPDPLPNAFDGESHRGGLQGATSRTFHSVGRVRHQSDDITMVEPADIIETVQLYWCSILLTICWIIVVILLQS